MNCYFSRGWVMKGIQARRIRVKVGDAWQSPALHVLLTKEDDVIVSRCLDFTVSSHGKDEKEALDSLAAAIKEYVLTAVENDAINGIFDPAHGKYWRLYNELEAKQTVGRMKSSLKKSLKNISSEKIEKSVAKVTYA
jgi:predicted RNase H-like HicB family nuclease